MKKIETKIKGVYIIEPDVHGDERGWFMESYNEKSFKDMGIDNVFVQDNMSFSAQKGTLRGLHYQREPYGEYVAVELSEENKTMFFLPHGMAHGFLTLTDNVEFQYKCDNLYNKESEGSIRYDDKTIGIDWGTLLNGIEPVLSEKDKNAPVFGEHVANFKYED